MAGQRPKQTKRQAPPPYRRRQRALPSGTRSPAQKVTPPSPQKPSTPEHIPSPISTLCQNTPHAPSAEAPNLPCKKSYKPAKKVTAKPAKNIPTSAHILISDNVLSRHGSARPVKKRPTPPCKKSYELFPLPPHASAIALSSRITSSSLSSAKCERLPRANRPPLFITSLAKRSARRSGISTTRRMACITRSHRTR